MQCDANDFGLLPFRSPLLRESRALLFARCKEKIILIPLPIACSLFKNKKLTTTIFANAKPDKKQSSLLFIPPGTEMFYFPGSTSGS